MTWVFRMNMADNDGFNSRLAQELFVQEISLTSLGKEYFRACRAI